MPELTQDVQQEGNQRTNAGRPKHSPLIVDSIHRVGSIKHHGSHVIVKTLAPGCPARRRLFDGAAARVARAILVLFEVSQHTVLGVRQRLQDLLRLELTLFEIRGGRQ